MGPFLSIELNELHKDQPDTATTVPPRQFSSAADFVLFHYNLIMQGFETPIQELPLRQAQREVFALRDLQSRLSELVDPRWNHGPFLLAHSDLRPSNIIVDDNLNIQGIIDWEWVGAVPRQMFLPPTWLLGQRPCFVASDGYSKEYAEFYTILADKGTAGSAQLAEEWGPDLLGGLSFPLAVALRHPSEFTSTYYEAMYPKFFQAYSDKTVASFFEKDGGSGSDGPAAQARRYVEASERYTQYLKDNGLFVVDERAQKLREWQEKRRQMWEEWENGGRERLQQEMEESQAKFEATMRDVQDLKRRLGIPSGPVSSSSAPPAPPPCP